MKVRAVLLVCFALLFALTPLMLPGFRGYDPEDFPVSVLRPAAQPAGYAFSIWLVIYAGLLAHSIYGLVIQSENPMWDRNRTSLMAAMFLGTLWVAFADSRPVLATVIILGMALAANLAALRTASGGWWQQPPVALFAGWVTAAAGVAMGVTAAGMGWLENSVSAYAALGGVLVVAIPMQRRLGRAPAYALAVIWALIGVAVANRTELATLTITALIATALMAAAAVIRR